MSGKNKITIADVLDKLGVAATDKKDSFQEEIELQASYLKDHISDIIKKDKKQAQERFEENKNLRLTDSNVKKIKLKDQYRNPMTLNGTSNVLNNHDTLGWNNLTLNWWMSIAMYDTSGIFKISVDTLSQDLIKAGVTPNLYNVIKKKHVQKLYNSCKPELINAMKNTQLFGGAIGVIMFDNITDYSKPLTDEQIRKAKKVKIAVYDRWQIHVNQNPVKDLMSEDHGLPESYSVFAGESMSVASTRHINASLTNVHHSYVMRFILRQAPKIMRELLNGWGYAEIAHIYTELMQDHQLRANVVSLTNKALLEVVQMSGMKGLFSALADMESQQEIESRLEMVNRYRNNNSLIFLDKEDQYSQFSFGGLSGLADLLEVNRDTLCAIREMSKLLLFGDTKGGLSGNADAEYLWYQGKITGKQEEYLRRPLTKLVRYLSLMAQADDDEVLTLDYKFNSIIPESEETKTERFDKFVDSLNKLKDMGIYDEEDVKQEVISRADEFGVGIAPYKLKTIYDVKEQEKKSNTRFKMVSEGKILNPDVPKTKTEKFKIVPTSPTVVEEIESSAVEEVEGEDYIMVTRPEDNNPQT